MLIVQISLYTASGFSRLYITYPQVLELTLLQSYLLAENATLFFAAVAIYTVPIFFPPGTQYYWEDWDSVDSKLVQSNES